MNDYTWPSVYFAYFFFTICLALALFFFVAVAARDGYWSKDGEDIKYQVFDEEGRMRGEARWKPKSRRLKEYADGWITEREGTEVPALPEAAPTS